MATHYIARELAALGHEVKQVPAAYAKPFRQVHKNEFLDWDGRVSRALCPIDRHGTDDRLSALVHMNMLNPHELRAAAP